MKIREIILEAPQQMPNFGTAGQSYNVNYNTAATPAKAAKSTAKATKLKAGPKGLSVNVNGNYTTTSPSAALQNLAPTKVAAAKTVKESMWSKFTGTKIGKILTSKYVGPFLIWLDDMSSINELWNAGAFNDHGNKAGEVAQQVRTYYTQLLVTRMGTMWVAWGTAMALTGGAVRGLIMLIPGFGWLANVAAVVAQLAVYAALNSEVVQKFLTFTILENLAPEWVNDITYGVARTVGGAGSQVGEFITQLKKKFVTKAPDAAAATAKAAPGVVKDAEAAIKNTGTAIKNTAKDAINPSTSEPTRSMSDLAKEL
jgi:hypothetical protein